jgi:hypothetical protein
MTDEGSLFCTETALPLIPHLSKHCWGAKIDKKKNFDFANSLSFAFYSRHHWDKHDLGDNWQKVNKDFILYETTLSEFPTFQNPVER